MHELDLVAVAKSFGFTVPPKVHLAMESVRGGPRGRKPHAKVRTAKKTQRGPRRVLTPGALSGQGKAGVISQKASGHGFSAANPYGARKTSDQRQFVH